MAHWRLGRGPYFAAWAVLVAVQLAPLLLGLGWAAGPLAGWVAVWQLAKLPLAIARSNDLGRAPDDAVFGTLVPVANLYLFLFVLLGATPTPARWERLRSGWVGQPSWYTATPESLRLMAATAGPGLLGTLILAVPQVILLDRAEAAVPTWGAWPPEELAQATSGALAVTGFLGLYTAIQLGKRATASPSSWIPSVFFVPSLWVAGALLAIGSEAYGTLTPLHVGLVTSGLIFAWHSTVGAAVTLLWVLAAHAAHEGRPASLAELWEGLRSRLPVVLPAHAGRVQLVWVGGQVIVPGLFYWVYAAFVVMVGALETPPPHPLTRRSGQLSWGMMSRLVKLCLVYALLLLSTQGVVLALHGLAVVTAAMMMDTSQVPLSTQVLVEVLGTLAMWWVTVVLYLLYRARVAQLDARQATAPAATDERVVAGP